MDSAAISDGCLKPPAGVLSSLALFGPALFSPALFGHPENVGENDHGISREATRQIPDEGLSQDLRALP
jgi:hypothetical protein